MKPIVAFLQNQWFKEPDRIRGIIDRTVERESERGGRDAQGVREYFIAAFLFMGCVTGRRLKSALGEEWCSRIIWEEVSRKVGDRSSASFPADLDHMRSVLARHKPQAVVALGSLARDAIKRLPPDLNGAVVVYGPHPASRSPEVVAELRCVRVALDRLQAVIREPAKPEGGTDGQS